MIAHCLFEQSGTFKDEFKKLGVEAYDYDILNEFGKTDYVIDLFDEIQGGYDEKESIFDEFSQNDIIMAFFPCTRFEAKIPLGFRGEMFQQKNWDDIKKLEYSIKLHEELHDLYTLLCKMVIIALRKKLRMVIENPYTQPHYLTTYWCLKPDLIDKDRRIDGDYYKKPTQFWFINCKPKFNFIFEPISYVEQKRTVYIKNEDKSRKTIRSMMHPQYANRFIRKYILDKEE